MVKKVGHFGDLQAKQARPYNGERDGSQRQTAQPGGTVVLTIHAAYQQARSLECMYLHAHHPVARSCSNRSRLHKLPEQQRIMEVEKAYFLTFLILTGDTSYTLTACYKSIILRISIPCTTSTLHNLSSLRHSGWLAGFVESRLSLSFLSFWELDKASKRQGIRRFFPKAKAKDTVERRIRRKREKAYHTQRLGSL